MARGGKPKSQRKRELCYSSLLFDILAKEILSASFLRATWEFTGAPGDYERLIARKRQDSPLGFSDIVVPLDFPVASEHASFNSFHSASNCYSPAIKSDFI